MAKNHVVVQQAAGSLKQAIISKFTETKVIPPPTKDTYYRGSGIAMVCPREEVLAAIHNVTRSESLNADSLVNFALGTGIHVALQEVVLPKIDALLGQWACLNCGLNHLKDRTFQGEAAPPFDIENMIPRPKKCVGCWQTGFRYVEQSFKDDVYKITGHPDGFLRIEGRDTIGLLEAKSISKKGAYEVQKVPKYEHVIQAQIYMWFAGLEWACILYWDKGVYGSNCFIEHFVERDESTIEVVQNTLLQINNGIQTGELPDRICATANAPRALSCPCRELCFKEDSNESK